MLYTGGQVRCIQYGGNVRQPLAVRYSGMFIISEFLVRRDGTSDSFWNFSGSAIYPGAFPVMHLYTITA